MTSSAGDFWVFGYGSLMWRPDFPFAERRVARLHGYHRRFCMISTHHRGTEDQPGLVLALAPGGSCKGVAYRVAPRHAADVHAYLFEREMPNYAYVEKALTAATGSGRIIVHTYVADHTSEKFVPHLPPGEAAAMIRRARGISGANLEYLENTVRQLRALGLPADGFQALLDRARWAAAA